MEVLLALADFLATVMELELLVALYWLSLWVG
jgi:hypothetical protein